MMELKSYAKPILKFEKSASQSSASWSSGDRGTSKDESPKSGLYDKTKSQKTFVKENTKPQEIRLRTQQRAIKRAIFNYEVATKLYIIQQQKKQEERIQKLIEAEEIRVMRKEMIPRAQLMPFFDKPFFPQRSSRPLTVPIEPSLGVMNRNCSSSAIPKYNELYTFRHSPQALVKAIYK